MGREIGAVELGNIVFAQHPQITVLVGSYVRDVRLGQSRIVGRVVREVGAVELDKPLVGRYPQASVFVGFDITYSPV